MTHEGMAAIDREGVGSGPLARDVAADAAGRAVGRAGRGLELRGLVVLYVFTAVALAGYAVFGRDPSRVAEQTLLVQRFYGASFGFFAQAQVWLAGVVLALLLVRRAGGRWLAAFVVLYALSLASELAGTMWGVPFGAYGYGTGLGPRWLERVPVVIPLSWFCMAIPSYALARHLVGGVGGSLTRVFAGSLVLLAWDVSLDPAMSYVTRYWFWPQGGAYYGMPLSNLLGWYITGLALLGALRVLRSERWIDTLPGGWLAAYWCVNVLLPVGMNAVAGLAGAVLAGVLLPLLLAVAGVVRRGGRVAPSGASA